MLRISIITDGDNAWPDLPGKSDKVTEVTKGFAVARLPGGMSSGKSSVMLRLDLPDSSIVLAQTSMALFQNAAAALKAADER